MAFAYGQRPFLSGGRGPVALVLVLVLLVGGWAWAQGLVFGEAVLQWVQQRYGDEARQRVEHLQDLVDDYADASEQTQLEQVNRFFNGIAYDSDFAMWDRKDYWATPYEVLGIDAADCEDYAISKYFTLISMGVAEERLRITYVKSLTLDEAHMVLAYYPTADAEPLILDNLRDSIEPAGRRADLVPVYSFNGADLWLAANRADSRRVGSADRLSRWQAYQARLNRQMAVGIDGGRP
ncbi:MAG: transglutaminase-like cysteine peptidase [Gammaproteobacteria bacterium]|nr:transglutaminase-like cysteine peptidase [Gammaproteobacteria bacterium]